MVAPLPLGGIGGAQRGGTGLENRALGRVQNRQSLRCAPCQYPDISRGARLVLDDSAHSEIMRFNRTGHREKLAEIQRVAIMPSAERSVPKAENSTTISAAANL